MLMFQKITEEEFRRDYGILGKFIIISSWTDIRGETFDMVTGVGDTKALAIDEHNQMLGDMDFLHIEVEAYEILPTPLDAE